jgi:hypothetical protein
VSWLQNILAFLVLLIAAVLEVGGDALVRKGLHSSTWIGRIELLALGGFVLLSYGVVVNLPTWDFGRLLGVYVALFFLVAQVINYISFSQAPTLPILVGGLLIMSGGMLITFWKP